MRSGKSAATARGFAYVLLLVAIAVVGLTASASLSLGAKMARRDAEQQLLAIGQEFQGALHSYAGGSGQGPRALEDLLKDPRSPGTRRHLRQLYADPLTGRAEWGTVKDAAGAVIGVYSLAEGQPIRQTEFEPALASFEAAESYAQWVFGLPAAQRVRVGVKGS